MIELAFLTGTAASLAALLHFFFHRLHHEGWQVAAVIPREKEGAGWWRGANLTYYGIFTACSAVAAGSVFLVLAGAAGVPFVQLVALVAGMTLLCAAAAKWSARWIEGKAHTFSVAGAVFMGMLAAPLGLVAFNRSYDGAPIPVLATLAAISTAYVIGEGLGRLGCISFGCCYGRPIDTLPPGWSKRLARFGIRFRGHTKKIAYASGLEGVPVVPIQAVTCVLYLALGLSGMALFLADAYGGALGVTLAGSQLWRAFSETLRADHRGGGAISIYQGMSLALTLFGGACALGLPSEPIHAEIARGLGVLWRPDVILLLQALWLGIFLFTGRSAVTTSMLEIQVRYDRV